MAHPYFDSSAYPWHRKDATELHVELYQSYAIEGDLQRLYKSAGVNPIPLQPQRIDLMWQAALDNLCAAGYFRTFCDRVLADLPPRPKVVNLIKVVELAEDPIRPTLLTNDRVFLDREDLRDKLQRLTSDTALRVLLVRGETKTGKTYTRHLIHEIAKASGEPCVYLFDGNAGTTDEVVDVLFASFTASDKIPPKLETDDAWYRKVCTRLHEVVKLAGKKAWVVIDDLGDYEKGAKIDRKVRDFFNRFALSMENPEFATWFRLVLIDYPEVPEGGDDRVPTQWSDFYEIDTPDISRVNAAAITSFALQWAKRKQKNLDESGAKAFADKVLTAAAAARAGKNPEPPILPSIHKALQQGLQSL